jgi:hypothetical protein
MLTVEKAPVNDDFVLWAFDQDLDNDGTMMLTR